MAQTSDRRMTADPADMAEIMRGLEEEESMEKKVEHCNLDRRMTADPADMAAMMLDLEEEEAMDRRKSKSRNSTSVSECEDFSLSSSFNTFAGRESICTVDVVHSVMEMLQESKAKVAQTSDRRMTVDPADIAAMMLDLDEEESIQRKESMSLNSTSVSQCEDFSLSSSFNAFAGRESIISIAKSATVEHRDVDRRMTVDAADIAAMMLDLEEEEVMETKKSTSLNTTSISECEDFSLSSSFNTFAGRESMCTTDVVHCVMEMLQEPESAPSPRRSRRLSGEEIARPASVLKASGSPFSIENTPSKMGVVTSSRKGLRSCLTKGSKPSATMVPMSPMASARKNVVFGPPKVAEFFKTSPATNMTPMRKETASRMFSMKQKEDDDEEVPGAADNSDEWDRLTNTSGGSPEPSDDGLSPLPVPGSPAFNKRYYAAEQETSPVRPPLIANTTSILRRSPRRLSTSSQSPSSPRRSSIASATSLASEVTGTVMLLCPSRENKIEAAFDFLDSSSHSSTGPSFLETILMAKEVSVSEEVSLSSPMSSVRSNESVLSFRRNSSSMKKLDMSTASQWEENTSQMSNRDGATVELEERLQDMIEEITTTSRGKKTKGKKRMSLRGRSTPVPAPKYVAAAMASPWVGDMSVIDSIDDDHTARLEENLGDIMSGSTSSAEDTMSSPPALCEESTHVDAPEAESVPELMEVQEMEVECSINISTASTKSFDSAHLDSSISSEVVVIQQTNKFIGDAPASRTSDIGYLNLVQGADAYCSFADVSICSAADRSMNTSVVRANRLSTTEGKAMMQRLAALNAGARLNSLDQCGTPLAAKGTMSIGMKRHSLSVNHRLAKSSTKRPRASVSGPISSRHFQTADVNESTNLAPIISTPSKSVTLLTATTPLADSMTPIPSAPPSALKSPEPLAQVELVSVFSALALEIPFGNDEHSSSVLAAAQAVMTSEEYDPKVRSVVSAILVDILMVANKEAKAEAESMEEMQRMWSEVPGDSDVMKVARSLLTVSQADTDEVTSMKAIAQQCREYSTVNWARFEDKLLAVATATVEARNLEVLELLKQKKSKAAETAMALMKSRRAAVSSASMLAGRAQLKALQADLMNARIQLDSSADNLRDLQEEVSVSLELKKDQMIAMVEQREATARDIVLMEENEKAKLALVESEALEGIRLVEKSLHEVKQSVGLLNRLTYCRAVTYQSTCIEVEAVLSARLRVQVMFNLSLDQGTDRLSVDGTHVELKYVDTSESRSAVAIKQGDWDSETKFANAYFIDVMCSDEISGPLSESMLTLVACPADIPPTLQRVSDLIFNF